MWLILCFSAGANLIAGRVTALTWLVMAGVISLWCGWAAVTSAAIAHHLGHAGAPLPHRVRISHSPAPAH